MKLSDGLMILAVLLAPLVAVQVQKWLETFREDRARKLRIFKILMSTRATGLSKDHVQALNLIDLEFQRNKFKKVRDAWKTYLDHLGNFPREKEDQGRLPVWNEKTADLLADLLMEMGTSLGYDFDLVHVKKGIYLPEGHTKLETELSLIRAGAIRLLFGDASLKMDVERFPVDDDALRKQKQLNELWLKVLDGKAEIPVSIRESDTNREGEA